jgi:hypothetical protein
MHHQLLVRKLLALTKNIYYYSIHVNFISLINGLIWLNAMISELNSSPTAQAFAAQVDVSVPPNGLYLLKGRNHTLATQVKSLGGQVVLSFSPYQLLAALTMEAYLTLLHHRTITFIGPVTIDPKRLAHFLAPLNQLTDSVTHR